MEVKFSDNDGKDDSWLVEILDGEDYYLIEICDDKDIALLKLIKGKSTVIDTTIEELFNFDKDKVNEKN